LVYFDKYLITFFKRFIDLLGLRYIYNWIKVWKF